ncbi:DNA-binding protein WhiA [Corynebacterium sp. zg254]|uniref:Probable cell division protein WhiA n=1 Tax=Corynebacterium zhongnanshanii TaxID=2768834 RepID=A0ABQ6VGD8_9CORY|nr:MULTISPECIES: DNA-binding protein WhiA [Corynebacterium]KAB3523470.1 DNA-binding protein WhiA [Corynebacterium zhongnanshanii]MCR5913388.1 DNA-binding protein WhiA [Corynebacterium sp. zg254]
MALTGEVKAEIAAVHVTQPDVMVAEVASLLRYCGALHVVGRRLVVEAEVDSLCTAQRVMDQVETLFHLRAEMQTIGAGNLRRNQRFIIKWSEGGTELARRTHLIDRAGRPVRGLPRFIIGGTTDQCVAAWRGAFLAHGSLTEPGRSSALEVSTPGNEAALALVGCARRVDITAKTKEARGIHRVVIRDGDSISTLLSLMGAENSRAQWEEQRKHRENRADANRLANFDDANLRRSARAAVMAAARVERALEILGDDVPSHLAEAGHLRVRYRQASLEELGQKAEPPMTKDAVAGRIRRLLSTADKRAEELGIEDTHHAVKPEMLDNLD